MKQLKVAAVSLNQTPLEWSNNVLNIKAGIAWARREGARVVCLPELAVSGYGCEDAFFYPAVHARALGVITELASETKGLIAALGFPFYHGGDLYSAAALYVEGVLRGIVCKQFLAREGIHYEPRWFRAWRPGVVENIRVGEATVPCGDIYFRLNDKRGSEIRVGFEICEDAWASARPGTRLAERGVDLILNPSVSHFAFKKYETRIQFIKEGSRAFGAGYVYANLLGNEAGRAIYDGGNLIAAKGEILAAADRFSFEEVSGCAATLDIEVIRASRQRSFGSDAKVDGTPGGRFASLPAEVEVTVAEPLFGGDAPSKGKAQAPASIIKEEEFSYAASLGLFDYLRKSRSKGFVLSLSGGADSAAVAVLVRLMVELSQKGLGEERVLEKLNYWPELKNCKNSSELMAQMLCMAYQATSMSSLTTRESARQVAVAVGGVFIELEVEEIVAAYRSRIEKAISRDLSWKEDDLALQNIQARVRGPSVWMLANIRQSLLLATSNRSEVAVGYATMDGDTCGGLSPIAGVDKAFILRWLRWMERTGMKEWGPVTALSAVTSQAPTAELRPPEQIQTDEADLMPYPVLDAIERLAIRDRKDPCAVYHELRSEYAPADLKKWISKFFKLWRQNQWKRERFAPSFHLDEENLDPRTWCRFPILSGGFEEELLALQKLK